MLKMETVHVIRHLYYTEKKSQRAIARQLGVHRHTVRKYLTASEPFRVELHPRRQPVLETAGPRIDALLLEWADRTGGKHQITAQRLHRQLAEDGIAISARTVRTYLAGADWGYPLKYELTCAGGCFRADSGHGQGPADAV